ncbi:tripartite tricarboxylate transporter TctB family protein [Solicola gregarius]|uniref:Tripartite tricarboxylate transporter TctB family protein n=1 Tax=Solicola gregarius TaxID=2908642 RepID=A0AA46TGF0_9ACTN|nr:tripartite tricarboxylate transporter TctB family protein [Solicola gregarius]UYM04641.1 tripartite tricarboxylate transporter TctB family protein [Solicola gregarius]
MTARAVDRTPRLPRWLTPQVAFLAVLLVLFLAYTEMAFGMEWRTPAGRIGAGVFPRIVGSLAIVTIAIALYREVRRPQPAGEPATEGQGSHPVATLAMVAAAAFVTYWFLLLGAVLTGAAFLVGALWILDPRHRVRAVVLGIALPVAMYLLFQTGLNAGLPDGILPMP